MKKEARIGRKGLSPLIATVLLIAFAVALGTLLVNSIIKPSTTTIETPCERTRISLQELPTGASICYETTKQQFQFLIENTGTTTIDGLIINIIDTEQQVETRTLDGVNLPPGRLGSFNVEFKTISPNELTATIIPTTSEEEMPYTCGNKKLQSVGTPLC